MARFLVGRVDGTAEIDGKMVKVSYSVFPGGSKLMVPPTVERGETGDGIAYRIRATHEQIDGILKDINRKLRSKGFSGVDAEALKARGISVEIQPEIQSQWDQPRLEKPFIKIALGAGYYLFGDQFIDTDGAAKLRSAVWADESTDLKALRLKGWVWPNVPEEAEIPSALDEDVHVCYVNRIGDELFCACYLFGKFGAAVSIADGPEARTLPLPSGGILVMLDPATRQMRQLAANDVL